MDFSSPDMFQNLFAFLGVILTVYSNEFGKPLKDVEKDAPEVSIMVNKAYDAVFDFLIIRKEALNKLGKEHSISVLETISEAGKTEALYNYYQNEIEHYNKLASNNNIFILISGSILGILYVLAILETIPLKFINIIFLSLFIMTMIYLVANIRLMLLQKTKVFQLKERYQLSYKRLEAQVNIVRIKDAKNYEPDKNGEKK